MAVKPFTATEAITKGNHATTVVWPDLSATDTGKPIQMEGHVERSIQFVGDFNGAKIQFQGSNDGVTWQALTSKEGNTLEFDGPALASISEVVAFVRPAVTDGSPNNVDAYLDRAAPNRPSSPR